MPNLVIVYFKSRVTDSFLEMSHIITSQRDSNYILMLVTGLNSPRTKTDDLVE